MDKREYYLGLDMGTSSVGWAVTDTAYKLLRAKGKDLWGIREFDEANTAAERRTHRVSRRRRQREVARIGLLKYYFHDAIAEVDSAFYQRLEDSKYHIDDKTIENKNGIFNDDNFTDKDYYEKYPTIFHLRKELIFNAEEHDVRLVFLALLNMFKHRGHFLNAGLSSDGNTRSLQEVYSDFREATNDELSICFPENIVSERLEEILGSKDYSRKRKAEEVAKLLEIDIKDKCKYSFVKGICGLKVNATDLFGEMENAEDKKISICFAEAGYDENAIEILEAIGETYFYIVEYMKELYDIGLLSSVMKGYSYLSEARVASYEKHKYDLKVLKRVIKRYHSVDRYDEMFRSQGAESYSAYVNTVNSTLVGKKRRDMKNRKMEDLYKAIKGLVKGLPTDDADVRYILEELEKEKFLSKQLTASNGVIPNQVHAIEMKKILENAEKYLPFLKEMDESGYTVSERILMLFKFQIPYYVGPMSEKSARNDGNGWVVRKEDGVVLPWNIEEKIDMKKTSEAFIVKMVRRCTYMNGEMVLPKASLEYESFCVLNEINNLRIDGERIPEPTLKQAIYRDLFQKGKKVTRQKLVSYLIAQGIIEDATQVSGIDININSSLSTYGKFKAILGERIEEDHYKHMVEDIVFWCTIYGDSKRFLKERIEEKYRDELTDEQIKRILGFKFKDWGNLSKEFLEMQGCDKAIGESISLIRMMWETNYNLMELLNDNNYTYGEALEEKQVKTNKILKDMQPEDLDEFYFSAPVKRMVWQTLQIIKELEKILGAPPKRIFVEMTRKPDEKKVRTISRKQKFLELYKSVKKESRDWNSEIENADANGTLKSKKMYLYLTQKGRCMYTGKPIELSELFNDNLYDIDHIYPRHFVKDDNIDNNLVLVCKQVNAHKSDVYPLEETIYHSQKERWRELLRLKFITEEKYKRLTGRTPFTEEQKAGFIARQLVETSQGTKGISQVLKQVLPATEIVYSKASNVSEFRQSRGLVKCRSVNDFHHAHDAYLNIVVGNVYYVKFTKNPINFIKNEYARDNDKYRYNLSRMFDWDVQRGNEVAWVACKNGEEAGTIKIVKAMLAKNTPLMTRLSFEAHGEIANATLYSAEKAKKVKGEGYIPFKALDSKMHDVTRYGGYTKVSAAYFFLVEHDIKKKRVRTLETVPIYMSKRVEKDPEYLMTYCKEELRLINPSIRLPKIKLQALVKKDGYFMHISGKTGNQISVRNAINLCLKQEWLSYIKKLEKLENERIVSESISEEKNKELYSILCDKHKEEIYSKRPNAVGSKLKNAEARFGQLSLQEQCQVLNQILKLTSIGLVCADLTLIGEAAQCGVMLIPKKLDNVSEMLLINQSVTGVYENKIDLLTV